MIEFNHLVPPHAKARLIDAAHHIIDASQLGFSVTDRLELLRLLALNDRALGTRRIDELFDPHFFTTNFWRMWRTTFAFQQWHSAAELRRYFIRFIQEFPRIHTLGGVRRTRYEQYDSMVVPLQRWLTGHGVETRVGTRVLDADFATLEGGSRRVTRLHVEGTSGPQTIELGENGHAFLTLGSITADSRFGSNDTVPALVKDRVDHGWSLWERVSKKAPDFGRPMAFYGNVDENKWESFTLTMHDEELLSRIVRYSGNVPGTGGLMTFFASGWHLSIVVPHQPHFPGLPPGSFTLWGYGFDIDNDGDYVKKPMSQATGREVLTELVHQLGFEDLLERVLASTDVTTAMMPYASALFACRAPGDRPLVVPAGSRNFAFLGQFTELPEDVVFTVEYSIHGAMLAVYQLLGVNRAIPPIYHGLLDPKVGLKALETLLR
jgi:oleate hydratase